MPCSVGQALSVSDTFISDRRMITVETNIPFHCVAHKQLFKLPNSLNVAKTKFRVFYTSNKIANYPKLKRNDYVIERVQSFNFLGHCNYYMV